MYKPRWRNVIKGFTAKYDQNLGGGNIVLWGLGSNWKNADDYWGQFDSNSDLPLASIDYALGTTTYVVPVNPEPNSLFEVIACILL